MDLIVKRVILLLFPTMSALAAIFMFATVDSVILDKGLHLPIWTLFLVIIVQMRLPSIVLPIVSIHTDISWMRGITVRTPNGFEMEHVEVIVARLHLVQ